MDRIHRRRKVEKSCGTPAGESTSMTSRISGMPSQKFDLHGRRGKGTAESFSRLKLRQVPQKEGGKFLCNPGWCVHKSDVQNKWELRRSRRVLIVCIVIYNRSFCFRYSSSYSI